MDDFLRENFESMSDREMARELELPQDEVSRRRKELGLLKLDSLIDSGDSAFDIELELGEMDCRRLQGFLGERIARLMKSKILRQLGNSLESGWVLRERCEVLNAEDFSRNFYAGRRPSRGETELSGSHIRHWGHTGEELREIVRERSVALPPELFESFLESRAPFTDQLYYGFKIQDTTEKRFATYDLEKPGFDRESSLEAEVPVADDFKLLAVEVKTTSGDPGSLLSTNQRELREKAKSTPFLDFYVLHVDLEFDDLDVPESYSVSLSRESKP